MSEPRYDVAIVGRGPVGARTALLLADAGCGSRCSSGRSSTCRKASDLRLGESARSLLDRLGGEQSPSTARRGRGSHDAPSTPTRRHCSGPTPTSSASSTRGWDTNALLAEFGRRLERLR